MKGDLFDELMLGIDELKQHREQHRELKNRLLELEADNERLEADNERLREAIKAVLDSDQFSSVGRYRRRVDMEHERSTEERLTQVLLLQR